MLNTKQNEGDIGVIVGRFQVHKLHEAHLELIHHVRSKHKKIVIVLGVSRTLASANNPLDFIARQQMIQESFPDVQVIALKDNRSDDLWSKELDSRIREVCPIGKVVLYGGRDSFVSHYKGNNVTTELESDTYFNFSGTAIRKEVSQTSRASADFRAGVIYGCSNRFPSGFPTVDVAVFQDDKLLLAKKLGETKWRFLGGFFDPAKDKSLEAAGRREAEEETGGMVVTITDYIGSYKIDDWRYRSEKDKIITTFYEAKRIMGPSIPSDDISELAWIPLNRIQRNTVMEEHVPLMDALLVKRNVNYFSVENNDITDVPMNLEKIKQNQ